MTVRRISEKTYTGAILALLVFSLLVVAFSVVTVRAQLPTTVLGICLDGSGSISGAEWDIMVDGVSNAIQNDLPHDGRVELVVVQFAGWSSPWAVVEYGPTVIDSATRATEAANIVKNIGQMLGGTPTADGLWLTWDTMKTASMFDTADKRVINLATDGSPSERLHFAPSPHFDEYLDAEWVVEEAAKEGLDELDAEGVGIAQSGIDWLRDEVVYPPPGFEVPTGNANPYDYDGDGLYDPGWVRPVKDFQEFADTIGEKLARIVVTEEHDVEAVSQTVTDNKVLPGSVVDIEVTVRNPGAFTESFNVTCYYDSVEIGTKRVENLAPGASTTVTFTWDTTGVPQNGYQIKALADSGMEIVEVDEVNNWCEMPLPLLIVPEVPLGTILTVLGMFIALAGFLAFKRFRLTLQPR